MSLWVCKRKKVIDEGIFEKEREVRLPGEIECEVCKKPVELYDPWENICNKCGQPYNLSGQMLEKGRSQWGEETGESYMDIINGPGRDNDEDWDPYSNRDGSWEY